MELIVFDLDGTLLNDASRISTFTRDTLKLLANENIAYTVATGRTLHSAQNIIDGHGFDLPHIYSNGVITWDPKNEILSLENLLTVNEANHILESAFLQNITPFISSVDTNNQHFIYHPDIRHSVEKRLLNEFLKRPDVIILPVDKMPVDAQITNISMLGEGNKIDGIQQSINTETHLIAYSGPALEGNGLKWIDIHHSNANKGSAIERLKQELGISKLVCFGDSDNDLSMFAMADESYAPANANKEVKAAATAIIGDHDADGIAYFLRERFNL
ncbi:MAG: HAD family hydrolase [Cellvibrionaceae bacterium]